MTAGGACPRRPGPERVSTGVILEAACARTHAEPPRGAGPVLLAPLAQTKVLLGDDVVPFETGRAAESRARPETRMAENRFFVERRPDELLGESQPLIKMGPPGFLAG